MKKIKIRGGFGGRVMGVATRTMNIIKFDFSANILPAKLSKNNKQLPHSGSWIPLNIIQFKRTTEKKIFSYLFSYKRKRQQN